MLIVAVAQSPTKGTQINASIATGDVVDWAWQIFVGGVALNLTGYTLKMTIGFADPVVLDTGNGGINVTDAAAGKFTINIPSTDTADYAPGVYPYDLWIEYDDSPVAENQYMTGNFTVNQSVTQVP